MKKNLLLPHRRYQSVTLPQDFSDEEMARDWTLSTKDKREVGKYRKNFRLFIAVQICAVRLYGRFLSEVNDLSSRIINYLNKQLELPPLVVYVPDREATYLEQRKNILHYLVFRKFDESRHKKLQKWLEQQARQCTLPHELLHRAERYLLENKIILPG